MSSPQMNPTVTVDPSPSDIAIERFSAPAAATLAQLTELTDSEFANYLLTAPTLPNLHGCIFVGHKATDLDSIASAVACAELFRGVAARASEVNSETRCALELWGAPLPDPFADVSARHLDKKIVIVDHNQLSQTPDGLDLARLHGCIDHHALQGRTVMTSAPIFVAIQPWGSACTIVAHLFFAARRKMSRSTAGMLLSGIISDTLNLRSPTATDADRHAVSLLARLAHVPSASILASPAVAASQDPAESRVDVNLLAQTLFRAKSREVLLCTPTQLVRGDLKTFDCRCRAPPGSLVALEGDGSDLAAHPSQQGTVLSMAFGVIETTDLSTLTPLRLELQRELRALKREEHRDLAFLALVDIERLHSLLIPAGEHEVSLALAAFSDATLDPATGLIDIKARVSRKKDLIPPIEACLREGGLDSAGWVAPPLSDAAKTLAATEKFGKITLECTPKGCQLIRHNPLPSPDGSSTAAIPLCLSGADTTDASAAVEGCAAATEGEHAGGCCLAAPAAQSL